MFSIEAAPYKDVKEVINNLRVENRNELEAAGESLEGSAFHLRCFLSEVSLVLRKDFVPICIFGANVRDRDNNEWQAWLQSTPEFDALAWRAARRGYIKLVIPAILAHSARRPPEVQCLILKSNLPVVRFVTSLGAEFDPEYDSEHFLRYVWDDVRLRSNLRQLVA